MFVDFCVYVKRRKLPVESFI